MVMNANLGVGVMAASLGRSLFYTSGEICPMATLQPVQTSQCDATKVGFGSISTVPADDRSVRFTLSCGIGSGYSDRREVPLSEVSMTADIVVSGLRGK